MHANKVVHNLFSTVISGSRDATLRVWDIEIGDCTMTLSGHVAAVRWYKHTCTFIILCDECVYLNSYNLHMLVS